MVTDAQFEQLLEDYVLHIIQKKVSQNALDPNFINNYRVSFKHRFSQAF